VAVTSEQASFDDYIHSAIPVDRILSMLAGEVLRLEAYAASGLIDPGEPVSAGILAVAHGLRDRGFSGRAIH
jgi:hypothetical protein